MANLAVNDPAGEWHSQTRDCVKTRFNQLADINAGNVEKLRVAWTFSGAPQNGHEAAPLVLGDTM
jgi:alcohol dehydrogenase (cytochrome c)